MVLKYKEGPRKIRCIHERNKTAERSRDYGQLKKKHSLCSLVSPGKCRPRVDFLSFFFFFFKEASNPRRLSELSWTFELWKIRVYKISKWATGATLRLPFQKKGGEGENSRHIYAVLSCLSLRGVTSQEEWTALPQFWGNTLWRETHWKKHRTSVFAQWGLANALAQYPLLQSLFLQSVSVRSMNYSDSSMEPQAGATMTHSSLEAWNFLWAKYGARHNWWSFNEINFT